MYLIVGLGNPDKKFHKTFHNVGFLVLDKVAEILNTSFDKREGKAQTAHSGVAQSKIILAKPLTYMNLSGESVSALMQKYKIEKQNVLIVCDDVDLNLGSLRLKSEGSGGTHNGLKNIVACLGETAFARLKVGVGKAPHVGMSLADFVLSEIPAESMDSLLPTLDNAAKACCEFAQGVPAENIMQKFNKK